MSRPKLLEAELHVLGLWFDIQQPELLHSLNHVYWSHLFYGADRKHGPVQQIGSKN